MLRVTVLGHVVRAQQELIPRRGVDLMRASRFTAVRTESQGRCAGGRARAAHGGVATHEHRGRPVPAIESL
ncbi:hypothetical protein ACWFRM_06645, partial [Streptomyces sp. NPDC055144]